MRSALESNYYRPKERQSVYRFNWPITEVNKSVTIRIISAYQAVYRFWYPSYNFEKDRQANAVFNLSAGLQDVDGFLYEYPNSNVSRSQAEQSFINLHNEILKLRKNNLRKKLENGGLGAEEIEDRVKKYRLFKRFDAFQFGPGSKVYGCQAIIKGEVRSVELKATTVNPKGNRYREPEFEVGIRQIFSTIEDDKLVYPPFLTRIMIEAVMSKYTANKKPYLVYKPTPLVPEEFKNVLPKSFYNCIWVHPDDVEIVQNYLIAKAEPENIYRDIPIPFYRDYPDNNGTLAFVSRQNPEEIVEIMHIYDIDKELTPEIVKKIAERKDSFEFDPSTQESLLGGNYVEEPTTERFLFLNNEQIAQAKTGEKDGEGNIIVDLAKIGLGEYKLPLREHVGKLVRSPFNPFVLNQDGDLFWPEAEEIAKMAEEFGVPVYYPNREGAGTTKKPIQAPTPDVTFHDSNDQQSTTTASAPVNVVYQPKTDKTEAEPAKEIPADRI